MKLHHKILSGLVVVLIAISIYLLLTRTRESNDVATLSFVLIALATSLIILGNSLITTLLDRRMPWAKYKGRRFALQIVLGIALSLTGINYLYLVLKDLYTDNAPDLSQLIPINIYGIALTIPCITIYFGVKFLKEWNTSQLQAEKLQKENARSQMMSLRNHLDPHFLFNNLNILSSLIDHDVALSKTYLDKFAEVYRTILKSELSDLTTLREELELLEAYNYLIKIRWRDALIIKMNIDESMLDTALPPLAGQMLIENAIKHNTISTTSKLTIDISTTSDNFLVISNSKHLKKYADETREGTGLENIKNRYQYFTDRKMVIINTDEEFKVKLPLLTIE